MRFPRHQPERQRPSVWTMAIGATMILLGACGQHEPLAAAERPSVPSVVTLRGTLLGATPQFVGSPPFTLTHQAIYPGPGSSGWQSWVHVHECSGGEFALEAPSPPERGIFANVVVHSENRAHPTWFLYELRQATELLLAFPQLESLVIKSQVQSGPVAYGRLLAYRSEVGHAEVVRDRFEVHGDVISVPVPARQLARIRDATLYFIGHDESGRIGSIGSLGDVSSAFENDGTCALSVQPAGSCRVKLPTELRGLASLTLLSMERPRVVLFDGPVEDGQRIAIASASASGWLREEAGLHLAVVEDGTLRIAQKREPSVLVDVQMKLPTWAQRGACRWTLRPDGDFAADYGRETLIQHGVLGPDRRLVRDLPAIGWRLTVTDHFNCVIHDCDIPREKGKLEIAADDVGRLVLRSLKFEVDSQIPFVSPDLTIVDCSANRVVLRQQVLALPWRTRGLVPGRYVLVLQSDPQWIAWNEFRIERSEECVLEPTMRPCTVLDVELGADKGWALVRADPFSQSPWSWAVVPPGSGAPLFALPNTTDLRVSIESLGDHRFSTEEVVVHSSRPNRNLLVHPK